MHETLFRELSTDDAPSFCALQLLRDELELTPDLLAHARRTKTVDWCRDLLGDPQTFAFGAFWGERLVGTAVLTHTDHPKCLHRAELDRVVVHPDARRQGIARELVRLTLDAAMRLGCTQVELDTTVSNIPAQQLYASFGFREFGRHPQAVRIGGVYEDTVLMVKML